MTVFDRSFPRICVALGFSSPAELSQAADREYKNGNILLEFRLDYLTDPSKGTDLIRNFIEGHTDARILATCRHKHSQGGFAGTCEQQISILGEAGRAGAVAVDLEIETAEQIKTEATSSLRESVPLVISYHNFETTPSLTPVLRRLRRFTADAYKIATTARKPTDNLRLLEFAKHNHEQPLIALTMSETGSASRVLSLAYGGLFTYAAPQDLQGTAAGQISAHAMRALYRSDKLSKSTRVYGVIADPVTHSKSPLIHNRGFQARRIDAVYLPFRVTTSQLHDWMTLATKLPVAGFSVTIPHKQRIIRYLDIVEPIAKRIGAVNTVWRKGGKWRGTNTDTEGVLQPLRRHLRLAHASVLIAGYGGGARAAAFAITDAGAKVTITGRNMQSAQALARAVKAEAISLADAPKIGFDVLLNATPVGMFPNQNETIFGGTIPAEIVFDMVYNPHETLLLRNAREQGCEVIYGSEMLLEQAASQFEIWSGETAPRATMQKALEADFAA